MSKSTTNQLANVWFNEYVRLTYWIGRVWTRRLLDWKGKSYAANDIEELAQDAVARGYDRFAKRCTRKLPQEDNRKKWICQCMVRACQDAVRNKSRFGSVSSRYSTRDDVTNRFRRIRPKTDEQCDFFEPVDEPIAHPVQQWEIREVVRCLPEHLQDTAVYASVGLTQQQSALLQKCCERTVRNRLREIREILDPTPNIYTVIVSALEAYLDKPPKRDGQSLSPILETALAG